MIDAPLRCACPSDFSLVGGPSLANVQTTPCEMAAGDQGQSRVIPSVLYDDPCTSRYTSPLYSFWTISDTGGCTYWGRTTRPPERNSPTQNTITCYGLKNCHRDEKSWTVPHRLLILRTFLHIRVAMDLTNTTIQKSLGKEEYLMKISRHY